MSRLAQDRRTAVPAIVSTGAGDEPAEPSRIVTYLAGSGDDHAETAANLGRYAHGRSWRVVTIRIDPDPAEPAWFRKGLLSAVTIVCRGRADGVVMGQAVFDELSPDDQSWLRQRLHHFGGFLHVVPNRDAGAGA
jgi:hypothetical protein